MQGDKPWVTELQNSLTAIATAAILRAYLNPGTIGGADLAPYLTSTIRREPSGAFVVSRPDGVFRAASEDEAVPILGEGWLKELASATDNADMSFRQRQVHFINGPALAAATAFLESMESLPDVEAMNRGVGQGQQVSENQDDSVPDPNLEATLIQYAHAETWNDAFVMLRDHRDVLLTAAAGALLEARLEEFEAGDLSIPFAQWYAGRLDARLNILRAARAYGLDEVWRGLGPNMPSWSQEKIDNPTWIPHWKTQ